MKVAGNRKYDLKGAAAMLSMDNLQRCASALRQGRPFYKTGVYRFSTFKEEDEWRMRVLTGGVQGLQP